MRIRRIAGFIAIIQSILFLEHFLLYKTWTFSSPANAPGALWTKLILGLLSVSFVAASLLAFRYTNPALRAFYRVAAVWLGLQNFLFPAALLSWIIFGVARLAGLDMNFHRIVEWLFGAAMLVGFYGVFNASLTRITRTTVRLAESAGIVARTKSGTHQRCASGPRAQRKFSPPHGGEDFERRSGRDFYRRRFV